MARRRLDETPEAKALRKIETTILTALEPFSDAISYARLGELTGLPLNILWAVSRDLDARCLLAIDVSRPGLIFCMSAGAVEARRRKRDEERARRAAERRA